MFNCFKKILTGGGVSHYKQSLNSCFYSLILAFVILLGCANIARADVCFLPDGASCAKGDTEGFWPCVGDDCPSPDGKCDASYNSNKSTNECGAACTRCTDSDSPYYGLYKCPENTCNCNEYTSTEAFNECNQSCKVCRISGDKNYGKYKCPAVPEWGCNPQCEDYTLTQEDECKDCDQCTNKNAPAEKQGLWKCTDCDQDIYNQPIERLTSAEIANHCYENETCGCYMKCDNCFGKDLTMQDCINAGYNSAKNECNGKRGTVYEACCNTCNGYIYSTDLSKTSEGWSCTECPNSCDGGSKFSCGCKEGYHSQSGNCVLNQCATGVEESTCDTANGYTFTPNGTTFKNASGNIIQCGSCATNQKRWFVLRVGDSQFCNTIETVSGEVTSLYSDDYKIEEGATFTLGISSLDIDDTPECEGALKGIIFKPYHEYTSGNKLIVEHSNNSYEYSGTTVTYTVNDEFINNVLAGYSYWNREDGGIEAFLDEKIDKPCIKPDDINVLYVDDELDNVEEGPGCGENYRVTLSGHSYNIPAFANCLSRTSIRGHNNGENLWNFSVGTVFNGSSASKETVCSTNMMFGDPYYELSDYQGTCPVSFRGTSGCTKPVLYNGKYYMICYGGADYDEDDFWGPECEENDYIFAFDGETSTTVTTEVSCSDGVGNFSDDVDITTHKNGQFIGFDMQCSGGLAIDDYCYNSTNDCPKQPSIYSIDDDYYEVYFKYNDSIRNGQTTTCTLTQKESGKKLYLNLVADCASSSGGSGGGMVTCYIDVDSEEIPDRIYLDGISCNDGTNRQLPENVTFYFSGSNAGGISADLTFVASAGNGELWSGSATTNVPYVYTYDCNGARCTNRYENGYADKPNITSWSHSCSLGSGKTINGVRWECEY